MPRQILLVDDSVTIHRVVEITFAREDCVLTTAKSVSEGITRAKEVCPDIVLADVGLPDQSGYDLCSAIRADSRLVGTACLLLTGSTFPYDDQKGVACDADGWIAKPFETQALIDKVADAIAKRSARSTASNVGSSTVKESQAPVAASTSLPAARPVNLRQTMIGVAPLHPPSAMRDPEAARPPSGPRPVPATVSRIPVSAPPPVLAPSPPLTPPPVVPAPSARLPMPSNSQNSGVPPLTTAPEPAAPLPSAALPMSVPQTMSAPMLPPPRSTPSVTPPPAVDAPPPVDAASVILPPSLIAAASPSVLAAPLPSPLPVPAPTFDAAPSSLPMVAATSSAPVGLEPVAPPFTSTSGDRVTVKTLPTDVPQMPRPSLIPHLPTPSSVVQVPPRPNPRATLMGIPALGGGNMMPGAIPLPPKPVGAWAPPVQKEVSSPNAAASSTPTSQEAAQSIVAVREDSTRLSQAVVERATRKVASGAAEYEAIAHLSREVIEQIVWEVVPELAETLIKEQLDRLVRERQPS
jgi:CheY-like chemotaxis protein